MTNTLNVGLDVGAADRREKLNPSDVVLIIVGLGANVVRTSIRTAEYEHNGETLTESTLVVDTDRPLTSAEMFGLALATRQEAIPQRTAGVGALYGPKAAEWGPYNPGYFYDHS